MSAPVATTTAPPPADRKLRRLLPYFRPYLGRTVLTVLLMLAVTASLLAGPALAQIGIDDGISAGDKTVLAVAVVFDGERMVVLKDGGCVGEVDAVLLEVRGGLALVPLKVHGLSICTTVHTVKWGSRESGLGLTGCA